MELGLIFFFSFTNLTKDENKYNFNKHEDVFLVILKYFDGDILLLKDNIKYNNK